MIKLSLLLAATFPVVALAQKQPDFPIEKARIKMGHVTGLVYSALFLAYEKGYFADRGLDVDLVQVRGGDTAYQVAGATIHAAGGSPDSAFFNGIKRGMPLVIVGSLSLVGPNESASPLMVKKDLFDSGKVTKVEHLKGRRIANLAPGGITEYGLAKALKKGGISIDDVVVVQPMAFPLMVDALITGAVDAARISEPQAIQAEEKGVAVRLSKDYDLNDQTLIIKFNRDFARQHPLVVTNFLIAYYKAAGDLQGEGWDRPENLKILERYSKIPVTLIKKSVKPFIPPNGEFNIENMMDQQRYHMSRGKLTYTDLIPIESVMDRKYLNDALKFLGRTSQSP